MIIHGLGACSLARFLREERLGDLDTSWLLHGPSGEVEAERIEPEPEPEPIPIWRYAAE
jgi:hypothetical protein